jgi:hypothetical protein
MPRMTIDLTDAAAKEIDRMCERLEMSRPELFRHAMGLIRGMSPNRAAAAETLAEKVNQFLECPTEPNKDEMRFSWVEFNDLRSST